MVDGTVQIFHLLHWIVSMTRGDRHVLVKKVSVRPCCDIPLKVSVVTSRGRKSHGLFPQNPNRVDESIHHTPQASLYASFYYNMAHGAYAEQ
jgi:hypothetical protein